MTRRIGLRCDAGPTIGVGHVTRPLAIAEELQRRDCEVVLLGDVESVPWVSAEVARLGIANHPGPRTPESLVEAARRLELAALVLDSYELDPAGAGALRSAGLTVLAIVDGDPRGQEADLYLDQNLDAEALQVDLPAGSVRLAGLRYALIRDAVRSLRPGSPRPVRYGTPRVLCFFGGTDSRGAAPVLASLLHQTGVPFLATVITASNPAAQAVRGLPVGPGQRIVEKPVTPALPQLIDEADMVLSAAGSATWELLCLGVCPVLIRVAENQVLGYDRMITRGFGIGLGGIDDLLTSGDATTMAVRKLRRLLTDPPLRSGIAACGWAEVDGAGRSRAVDALLARLT